MTFPRGTRVAYSPEAVAALCDGDAGVAAMRGTVTRRAVWPASVWVKWDGEPERLERVTRLVLADER